MPIHVKTYHDGEPYNFGPKFMLFMIGFGIEVRSFFVPDSVMAALTPSPEGHMIAYINQAYPEDDILRFLENEINLYGIPYPSRLAPRSEVLAPRPDMDTSTPEQAKTIEDTHTLLTTLAEALALAAPN